MPSSRLGCPLSLKAPNMGNTGSYPYITREGNAPVSQTVRKCQVKRDPQRHPPCRRVSSQRRTVQDSRIKIHKPLADCEQMSYARFTQPN